MTGAVTAMASAPVADLLTAMCILAMLVFGGQQGLFRAIAASFAVLTAFFAALAFGPEVASMLESFEIPAGYCLASGCIATAAVVAGVWRVAIDGLVHEDDVRFGGRIDKLGGAAVGAAAGILLAGAVQVAWSMLELPPRMRLEPAALRFDAGTRMLAAFVRGVRTEPAERTRLLDGGLCRECDTARPMTPRVRVSEPFDDQDGNGRHDDGEPFLDKDLDGSFTAEQLVVARDGQSQADVGLLDRYRLSAWRRIRVMHAPRITSPSEVKAEPDDRGVIYRIMAEDADGDELTFAIEQDDADGFAVEVDPADGGVRLRADGAAPDSGKTRFTARVSDPAGLQDEMTVTVAISRKRN